MKRVVVAMSGGVDSSVAAALMQQEGYEVIGVTMTLSSNDEARLHTRGCCSVWDVSDAEKVAWKLGIPHYVFNLKEQFHQHVVSDFLQEYARGRTPNPCRRCNQYIKFVHLWEEVRALGADYLVTGHYVRIRQGPEGRFHLLRGVDRQKDQSYVLACLTQEQLKYTRFPLGDLSKDTVRKMAVEFELPVADKKESQDLCFIPGGDTAAFLKDNLTSIKPGPIVDTEGKLVGEHKGLPFYTVGQRRGLGVALGEPHYVVKLRVVDNTLVVGKSDELLCDRMVVDELNWIQPGPFRQAEVQYRYNSWAYPAQLEAVDEGGGKVVVVFEEPQRALAPGQAAVFYDGDEVLGGGTIRSTGL